MNQDSIEKPGSEKEWKLIEKLMMSINGEQRKARRWGIFFKLLTFLYLFVAIAMFAGNDMSNLDVEGEFTAMVEVKGVIADGEEASADRKSVV